MHLDYSLLILGLLDLAFGIAALVYAFVAGRKYKKRLKDDIQ